MKIKFKIIDVLILLLCLYIFEINLYPLMFNSGFPDFVIYERAVTAYLLEKNPYKPEIQQHLFVYNPLVLHFFVFLEKTLGFSMVMLIIYLSSSVWFVLEAYKSFKDIDLKSLKNNQVVSHDYILLQLSALAFGGIGIGSYLTGNITLYLHLIIISCALGFFRTGFVTYKKLFFLFLLLFSIIKPYFLVYLALALLLNKKLMSAVFSGTSIAFIFAAIWFFSMKMYASEYDEFIGALNKQTLLGNDIGYSFFAIAIKAHLSEKLALIIHAVISLLILLITVFYLPSFFKIKENIYAKFFLLYLVLTFINPRMKEYDLYPALICFFIFLFQISKRYNCLILLGILLSIVPRISQLMLDMNISLPDITTQNHTWQLLAFGVMIMFMLVSKWFSKTKNLNAE